MMTTAVPQRMRVVPRFLFIRQPSVGQHRELWSAALALHPKEPKLLPKVRVKGLEGAAELVGQFGCEDFLAENSR